MAESLVSGKEVANVLIFENISMAVSAILANKMRALLTMLGIIIGIGSVIAIRTVGNSLTVSVTTMMDDIGASNVTVGVTQRSNEESRSISGYSFTSRRSSKKPEKKDLMTEEMLDGLLEEFPEDIQYLSINKSLGNGTVSRNGNSVNVSVTGGNEGYYTATDLEILAGSMLGDKALDGGKGVAVVSDKLVDKLFHGDMEEALGQKIEIIIGQKFYNFTIVGVYKYAVDGMLMAAFDDPVTDVYVPLKTVERLSHNYNYSSFTLVKNQASANDSQTVMRQVRTYFDRYYHANRDFEVSTSSMESLLEEMMGIMDTVATAISIIAGISLIVGGIGVMNIMLVSISERTREIGTRKALGATNNSIRLQFIIEAMMLCLVGGAIGVVVGVSGGSFAAVKLGYEASASVSSIVSSLAFSLAIGVFFGYYPANKAAKMNPIDALRYE